MAANKGSERKHLAREWELRGLMRCSCGAKMITHTTNPHGERLYHYYTCCKRRELRKMCTCRQRSIQAHKVEPLVWSFVSGLLQDPKMIMAGMNTLIDQERETGCRGSAEEAAGWARKIEECDHLRGAYQDQQAAGLMTLEELGSKLKGLEETRRLAQDELKYAEAREERVTALESDRDTLIKSWAEILPETLESLTGEQRNKIYRMLRLEVTPTPEGYSVTGALGGFLYSGTDTSGATPASSLGRTAAVFSPTTTQTRTRRSGTCAAFMRPLATYRMSGS